jgi:cytochrome c
MIITLCSRIILLGCVAAVLHSPQDATAQQNNPPQVKITTPETGRRYPLNTLIPYVIEVSDKEDGESKYDEINNLEVYMSVRYVESVSQKTNTLKEASNPDSPGFVLFQKSNCVNCHNFNSPKIGPSYAEITKRYPPSKANESMLAKKIVDGSTGTWGNVVMPAHPELTLEQTQQIVSWIFQNTKDPKLSYYSGAKGTIRLTIPEGASAGGFFILRASYTDHGAGNEPPQQSTDVVVINE